MWFKTSKGQEKQTMVRQHRVMSLMTIQEVGTTTAAASSAGGSGRKKVGVF